MYRVLLCVVLFLFMCLFPSGQRSPSSAIKDIYRYAEKLFYDKSPTDAKDSLALRAYLKVIALHPPQPDSILFDSYYKSGIYHQTANDFSGAIPFFQQAIRLHPEIKTLHDSLLFLPLLYLGNSYYHLSLLDSATSCYQRAEKISLANPGLQGLERLYNASGALSYELGNFQQSSDYFEKALHTLKQKNIPLEVTYKNNIAAALRKEKAYGQAMLIYQDLLKFNTNRSELLHNIGAMYLERDSVVRAIEYLQAGDQHDPDNLNALALAYQKMKKQDSSQYYLHLSSQANTQKYGRRKNIQMAITYRLSGEILFEKNIDSALIEFQQGIQQLIFSYHDDNTRMNPQQFEGQFSVIELFELLKVKAKAFYHRYQQTTDTNDLRSSLDTYDALYAFTGYVLRTYESPEARLYLSSRKNLLQHEPFDICLKLYALTNDRRYIEKAFQYDEQNKAAVLLLALTESGIKETGGIPDSLRTQEIQWKQKITRLSIQATSIMDSAGSEAIKTSIRDAHLRLSAIRSSFNRYPAFQRFRTGRKIISSDSIRNIIPPKTAVLCYHLGDTALTCFILTSEGLDHFSTAIPGSFPTQLLRLNQLVSRIEENNLEAIDSLTTYFYSKLISPAERTVSHFDHLVIIADDELNTLPFEILQNNKGKYLIETHDLTYNYSCEILRAAKPGLYPMLAMAPFVEASGTFLPLEASMTEVAAVRGEKLIGRKATKPAFISEAGHYKTLHLATHAVANDTDPAGSYISFYPEKDSGYNLYASEIVDLPLAQTNLVVLSACETASGKLVRGEGILSLTRAFAYAGCANTIASRWKADDASTAYILKRFYHHLDKNKFPAAALQMSIREYLDDSAIPKRLKTPGYWAHLHFVGNLADTENVHWLFMNLATVIGIIALVIIYKKLTSA